MNNEVLIEVSHLSRFYPGKHGIEERHDHIVAVDNISFTLQRGEILGFLNSAWPVIFITIKYN